MSTKIPIALAILGCCATMAAAEDLNLKPGLWELTGTYETKGDPMSMMSAADKAQMAANKAQMEEAKAHMSPEQRAQMEAMMKQLTANVDGRPKTSTDKRCLTKEDIHKAAAQFAAEVFAGSNCKLTPVKSTATVLERRAVCTSANGANSDSRMLFEAPNPETFTIRVESSVGAKGGLEIKARSNGKWLGPACGNVKP